MSTSVLAAHVRPSLANRDVKQPVARMEPTGRAKRAPDGKLHAIRGRSTSFNAAPGFHFVSSGLQKKKGKRNAGRRRQYLPHASGVRGAPRIRRLAPPLRLRARSPAGVPPRLSPKGVVVPKAQLRARLPGTRPKRLLPRLGLSQSSDAPRMPVVMPAGMMPKPPGCAADEAAPAGTALAPAGRHHRPASLRARLIRCGM
jgi:hypothetical protein